MVKKVKNFEKTESEHVHTVLGSPYKWKTVVLTEKDSGKRISVSFHTNPDGELKMLIHANTSNIKTIHIAGKESVELDLF